MATLSFPRSRRGSPTPPAELIPTKLQPPRIRPQLVGRSRLYERLDQGRERQLTLVTAPAGSGKSTLLAQWLRHSRYPAGWLALEESDNQPARFIRYLVAALRRACPALDDPVEPLLQATTAGLDLPQLLASLIVLPLADEPQPRILVLDDYHLIHNDSLHQAMDWLLAHLPAALHLVIASRHDPPLALARLRVRDELIEIRAADLRFNHDETAAFLRQAMDLELDDADIATLESRTEGWAAALQLSALSLRDCPDRPALIAALGGNHRPIADYLVAEVLDRQSGERREFLLRCALLERFCGPLCMAVTGRADAQAELEALERDNLFLIPLDHRRRWYRFHHLFAELLCRRLEQQRPAEIPVLLRRAALWHWQAGQVHEAITYARRAGDRELLVELLEAEGENLLMRGDTDAVRGWLEGLPDRLYRQRPRLAVLEGWCT
ncbi:MAG: AAA family ATPase, partial [Candidatus Competibacterales bacterium]|nr:AAA family ATPase [Candidatus Competibacterales bacterium]